VPPVYTEPKSSLYRTRIKPEARSYRTFTESEWCVKLSTNNTYNLQLI